ncbi:DUF6517 family protein [Halobaculum lipolyticum]|uniref:DUF6517 family protein n=1 Tax=Halobaculum lipolyticum TaxID=3032001 RepID=A0ABD5W9X5_9EURY|nr:DUF6517 family protein [Halobaculum sp. DT31]
MDRRRFVATTAAVAAAGLAGCSGSPTTFEAAPADTADTAADETGYEKQGTESRTVSREFAGTSVEVVNRITTYQKRIDTVLGSVRAGVFAAVSTPAVEVAGRTFNPVADYDTGRLVELLAGNYEGISDPTRVGESSVEVLGESRTYVRYEATATFEGREIDVAVHVTEALRDGADFVVPVAVYPRELGERGSEDARTLAHGIEHPA